MAELAKYKCKACGWIYDPKLGDAANEIPRGIAFEDLPEDFSCGVCGVTGKENFEKVEEPKKKKK